MPSKYVRKTERASWSEENMRQAVVKVRQGMGVKRAGRYWLEGFLSRHPKLSVRKAEGLFRARAIGMNRTQVMGFFKSLENVLQREGFFRPQRGFTMSMKLVFL